MPKLAIKEKMDLFMGFARPDRGDDAINTFDETKFFWLPKFMNERTDNQLIPSVAIHSSGQRNQTDIKNDARKSGIDLIPVGSLIFTKLFVSAA